ncbi:hypothetical protein BGZ92_005716 [Podila epicladia]|nr:hypothetical protein BGZ92_005716 [Podila epicladia]
MKGPKDRTPVTIFDIEVESLPASTRTVLEQEKVAILNKDQWMAVSDSTDFAPSTKATVEHKKNLAQTAHGNRKRILEQDSMSVPRAKSTKKSATGASAAKTRSMRSKVDTVRRQDRVRQERLENGQALDSDDHRNAVIDVPTSAVSSTEDIIDPEKSKTPQGIAKGRPEVSADIQQINARSTTAAAKSKHQGLDSVSKDDDYITPKPESRPEVSQNTQKTAHLEQI